MNRFHVNLAVEDVQQSIRFYSHLLGAEPTVVKDDYAKWLLDDPQLNFSITLAKENHGIRHLGLQVASREDLSELRTRLANSKGKTFHEGETTCCYAQSDKSWIVDPEGVEWEAFYTHGESDTFYEEQAKTACCTTGN